MLLMRVKYKIKHQSPLLQTINIKWKQKHSGTNPQAICSLTRFDGNGIKTNHKMKIIRY